MSEYREALEKCDLAIFNLWGAINDLLPDNAGNYLEEWTLADCEYLQKEFHIAANSIFSSVLTNHFSYEVRNSLNMFDSALEKKDIKQCKSRCLECCKVFHEIRIVCQRSKKLVY